MLVCDNAPSINQIVDLYGQSYRGRFTKKEKMEGGTQKLFWEEPADIASMVHGVL
jgi:hypothetical protein